MRTWVALKHVAQNQYLFVGNNKSLGAPLEGTYERTITAQKGQPIDFNQLSGSTVYASQWLCRSVAKYYTTSGNQYGYCGVREPHTHIVEDLMRAMEKWTGASSSMGVLSPREDGRITYCAPTSQGSLVPWVLQGTIWPSWFGSAYIILPHTYELLYVLSFRL